MTGGVTVWSIVKMVTELLMMVMMDTLGVTPRLLKPKRSGTDIVGNPVGNEFKVLQRVVAAVACRCVNEAMSEFVKWALTRAINVGATIARRLRIRNIL